MDNEFRFWDNEHKKMMYRDDYDVIASDFSQIEWDWQYDGYYKGLDLISEEKNKIMRYTGINDKNNNKIFESDIVKCTSQLLNWCTNKPTGEFITKYYEIIWYDLMFTARNIKDNYIYKISQSGDIWHEYFEVIGNIYENPELLIKG